VSSEKMSLEEVRKVAQKKLMGICGVYKICDGDSMRICEGQSYGRPLGIGGIGSGASFLNNVLALTKYHLKMHLIGEDFEPSTKYNFFGKQLGMPIMGASVAGVNSFGGEEVITEKEFCRTIVHGCKNAGTVGWRGDTYTYSLENDYGLDAIAEVNGFGVKIVKPRDQDTLKKFLKKAEQIGCIAVGIDIDGCGSYAMRTHSKPVYRKTISELKELINFTHLPFIIKGVMNVEDAVSASKAGAAAIVVSNHGGRVLDHTPGTAEVLYEIVKALKGRTKVFVDGGIRTGYDVLKMLALGAEAVLIGRDLIRAAVGNGIEGVSLQMEYLQKTLAKAMIMTNCKSLKAISSNILC
jgi:4-hydroxymandelate oxidase